MDFRGCAKVRGLKSFIVRDPLRGQTGSTRFIRTAVGFVIMLRIWTIWNLYPLPRNLRKDFSWNSRYLMLRYYIQKMFPTPCPELYLSSKTLKSFINRVCKLFETFVGFALLTFFLSDLYRCAASIPFPKFGVNLNF